MLISEQFKDWQIACKGILSTKVSNTNRKISKLLHSRLSVHFALESRFFLFCFAFIMQNCAKCSLRKVLSILQVNTQIVKTTDYLTNREALTVLCSVIKHAGSG